MSEIEILQAGLLTTVQDRGRIGYQKFGMPVAGVMDSRAYEIGQWLVGNASMVGALECTLLGPTFICDGDLVLAITGADMKPKKNGIPFPNWTAIRCKAGDEIALGATTIGVRTYVSFFGGITVPVINGSVSTYVKSGIGGYKGRKLKSGDRLDIQKSTEDTILLMLPPEKIPEYDMDGPVRVVLGPQDCAFTKKGIETFFHKDGYVITPASDRMGYRLNGTAIEHTDKADIISDGAVFGSIQVPANGEPIILMADRQTTGGYTKIGTVISVDLPRLAQMAIEQRIVFKQVSIAESQVIYREDRRRHRQRLSACVPVPVFAAQRVSRRLQITIKGQTYKVVVSED